MVDDVRMIQHVNFENSKLSGMFNLIMGHFLVTSVCGGLRKVDG